MTRMSYEFVGDGQKKLALTDLMDIGKFVSRIIEDDRTLNQYVFVCSEEWTTQECWDLGAKISGEDFENRKVKVMWSLRCCSWASTSFCSYPSKTYLTVRLRLQRR
jgi:hypothetical protein